MRAKIAALLLMLSVVFPAEARGPYGSIAVAGWSGGAFADDNSGEFSNCIASAPYKSGINFGVLVSRLVGRLHLPMQAGPYLKVRDFRSFSASMDGGGGRQDAASEGPTVIAQPMTAPVAGVYAAGSELPAEAGTQARMTSYA